MCIYDLQEFSFKHWNDQRLLPSHWEMTIGDVNTYLNHDIEQVNAPNSKVLFSPIDIHSPLWSTIPAFFLSFLCLVSMMLVITAYLYAGSHGYHLNGNTSSIK